MRRKFRYLIAVASVTALVSAATALAVIPVSAQVKTRKTSLGTILVDSNGKTLYLFMKDKKGKSSCSGSCAANWPPYLTLKKPKAGPGAKASLLGATKRSDGKLQVTYNHHPLYWFKFDTKAGQTKGENIHAFGADWYAVSAKGVKVEPRDDNGGGGGGPTGPTGPTGSGGYGGGGGYTP